MTLFAFGATCGIFGASGFANFPGSAAPSLAAKKSSPSSPDSATAPKPQPASQRNSRRVRPQKLRHAVAMVVNPDGLVHAKEFVQVQCQQAERTQGVGRRGPVPLAKSGQELDAALNFPGRRLALRRT